MFRTALRNVLAHKARLLMTMLAVLLGVAFVSGTLVFTDTVSNAMRNSSAKGFDQVDVALGPGTGPGDGDPAEPPKLTPALLEKAAAVPGAEEATGVVAGYAAVAGRDGELVADSFRSQGGNYWGDADPRYPLADGRAPRGAHEVVLDERTARAGGYEVGDTVRLSVDGPVLTPTLTGVFTTDDGSVAAGGSLALFDTATAQELFHRTGEYDEIFVRAAPGTSQDELRGALEAVLPEGVSTSTGEQLAEDQAERISAQMSSMESGLLVFAGIALFVGTFIISNTFSMLVAQRTRELALLRAVGASRRQITRSVLLEAGVVGAVAAAAGLAAGIGVGAGMRVLADRVGGVLPDGPLVIAPTTVAAAFAVGVLVTVGAAWLPGRRAAKIPPVAAMSSVHATATVKSLVLRNTFGALLAGAGTAVVLYATTMERSEAQAPMGLGAVLLILGVFVLTPLLSRPVVGAVAPVLRLFGVSGRLARQNAVRNPRRTAATASALMIGLTLITGMTVAASSLRTSIDRMATAALEADYVVSMGNGMGLGPEVERRLADAEGVSATSPLRIVPAEVDDETQYLTAVDGSAFDELMELPLVRGEFEVGGAGAVIDDRIAAERGWKPGTRITASHEDGAEQEFTVTGVYEQNEMFRGIVVDAATVAPHQERISDLQVMVKMTDGPSEANEDRLEEALGDNPAIVVQDKQALSEEIGQTFSLVLNMLYGLLAMAVVVAVLGVVNTLAMSVSERTQEIGMLRAVGMVRGGVARMIRLESLVISLFGGLLGVGLGVFFGWAAGELMGGTMRTYELVLPWGRIVLFLLLSALIGVVAALWPARRAARLDMLAAIKAD
ncbi:ABC transporter permease [Streptomyces chilikensis]|uniref:ABC transporter permease n=1 Tax=Streptomyces chilikensis TaxID=1194079 RepID=A0ABV3EIC9_9ACTN